MMLRHSFLANAALLLAAAALVLAEAGCQTSAVPPAVSSAQILARPGDKPGAGQTLFSSDKAAAAALLAAVEGHNHQRLERIFGPEVKELASGDKVEDHLHYKQFVLHAKNRFQLVQENPSTAIILIGHKSWPFPIPIVRQSDGKWYFDTAAGKNEILTRRIGGDELEAINVCRAYVIAQQKYFHTVQHASHIPQYAQRLASSPGKHDGLYWPAAAGQPPSPFSALAAQAQAAGYTHSAHHGPRPFFGYYFRILTRQGNAAPGGAMNYLKDGRMVRGFGLVAYPDKYGASGVMTFIVNQQGLVYQKDLGPQTAALAMHINSYNPDASWTELK